MEVEEQAEVCLNLSINMLSIHSPGSSSTMTSSSSDTSSKLLL